MSQKLNGTKCARLQAKSYHCCNLAAGHLQATGRGGQHVCEIFVTGAHDRCENGNVENEASGEDDESSCTLKTTIVGDVGSVSVRTFVAQGIVCDNINKCVMCATHG